MNKTKIRLAVRDWDYLTPLVLGDVASDSVDLEITRVSALSKDLATEPEFDGGEFSFARYARGIANGSNALFGVPHFLMRAFRQRCIITTVDSPLTNVEQLVGKRIGVTGWPDSGNTWTRAILRQVAINVEDVKWYAGRLTETHPILDRLGGYGRPGLIEPMPGELPLVDGLRAGLLDAVFTPFMPPGFFDHGSDLRSLIPDYRSAEVSYYRSVGYVPGIHILCLKRDFVQRNPSVPDALSALIDESSKVWLEKRRKYADTTPWIVDELARTARELSPVWNKNGLPHNARMISDFAAELCAQGVVSRVLSSDELFPAQIL